MGDIVNLVSLITKIISIIKEILITNTSTTGSFNALVALIIMLMGIVLIFGIGIFGTIFWIWMIIDCLQRKFRKSDDKLMWFIIIVLLHFIGAGIYYFIIKKTFKGF